MADANSPLEIVEVPSRPDWGAIWAGVFTFIAIWSVFGTLGLDIFARSANRTAEVGISGGIAIWNIVLAIIAMFVAGRITGGLAGITNVREGLTHGMIMFGLSVTSVLLVLMIGVRGVDGTTVQATSVIDKFFHSGWSLFLALFLGWLAALGGASTSHKRLPSPTIMQHQLRHA